MQDTLYHLLHADEFDAADAYRIGLVQEVVEPGRQHDRAVELARALLQCSPSAQMHTLANARLMLEENETAARNATPAMAAAVQATQDFQQGIASFIERRPARFIGR